jgi:hypothetical protein
MTGGKVARVEPTSQQMSGSQMSTLRGADEEADMDTTQAEGHEQEEMGRDGDQYNICMDMNESTTIQKDENDTM